MSAGLIKHLKEKTEQDPNTKILMSQWEFDEKLVGKSLENVGSYYPHFSSHNESHSQQILVNIERLLGDNINKLTATDTWLILEAAYWHDIGMLFNADDVQEVVNNEKFKDYVEELANNNVQDLHEFAKVWHNEGWEVALASYDNPYKGVEKYRQMIAEWYRQGHPDNSHQVVLKPFEKLNISSPRTELLPQRIYRYLAQICLSHGKSFNYVMSELPFRQTGMGTENCHPRFVACMLRLGDLFDIDDNRFCPVMARQVGSMPSLSEAHKHKHQAIREFQLDNETVSVTAICNTEMSYIECRRWFDWIKEEIQDQMSQWKNIVPSRDFGLLPTINKLDVEMADSKVLLNNKPMKFSLDERSAIELLQGNNLYHGEEDVVRELIQNAIDASLLKVWIDSLNNESELKILKYGNPYDIEVQKILKRYPITVSLEYIETTEDYENIWKLCIDDLGIGISIDDLKYMQYIAGSHKNINKKKLVRSMPRWMQPSGTFGIGMHSVFLLSKQNPNKYQHLKFLTKSINTHELLEIKLNSPLGKDNGYCFINYLDSNSEYNQYGTRTEIFLKEELQFSSEMTKSSSIDSKELIHTIANSLPFIFSNNAIPIVFKGINLDAYPPVNSHKLENNYIPQKDIAWFEFDKYSFAIQLYVPDTICKKDFNYESVYSFRGQEIYIHRDNVSLIHTFRNANIYIDIYGDAKEFLNIARNDWKSYDLMDDVINKVNFILESKNISQDKKDKLVYGFEYNKELGMSIISREINYKDFDNINIAELNLDDNTKISQILDKEAILFGDSNLIEKIIAAFKRDKKFQDIEAFNTINDIYYDETIKYFIDQNFTVYKVAFSGSLDHYSNRNMLFICKTEISNDIKFGPGLYIDDYNVAVFTSVSNESSKDNCSSDSLLDSHRFVDDLTNFSETYENNTIYIKPHYRCLST